MGLRRLLAGAAILMAALESCADKKVDKTMTDEKRSWGELTGGCRVSIAWSTSPAGVESTRLPLEIVFRNEGSATVQFPRSSLWFDYDFSVLTASGAEVPLTAFGKLQRQNLGFAAATVAEVAPGQEYRTTVELALLYELERPGSYSVQASKAFRDPRTFQFVTAQSNRLVFKVPGVGGR